jgi:hypothetical protein
MDDDGPCKWENDDKEEEGGMGFGNDYVALRS